MKKRLLSILLAAVMVFSLLPVTAFAKGAGHSHADAPGITFSAWGQLQEEGRNEKTSLPAESNISGDVGSFYLVDDVTLSETWTVPAGKTVNLCLNGFVIKYESETNGSVINVPEGATLNLYDCNTETPHYFSVDGDTGLWTLLEGEESPCKTITGGVITGGDASDAEMSNQYGGGVHVAGGTFNMYGGSIVGNMALAGSGVCVREAGSFTMNGGSIANNAASTTGGGVVVCGDFTMNGGSIADNAATDNGGGVRTFASGTFTMNGGSSCIGGRKIFIPFIEMWM